jgi:lysophospholipase L1-like esterase
MMNAPHAKIILFIVLVLGLVVSVALNALLFQLATNYYKEANAIRLNPLGIYYYPIHPTVKPNAKILVFFGDSRAQAWTSPKNVPFEIVNRGIGTQTSAQVAARFDYHVTSLRPQVIVVQVCINDLKDIPLFPADKSGIIARCKVNLKQIVEQSVQQNSTVVLTTIFPLGRVPLERQLFWSDDVGLAIVDVNAYIKSLASERVIIFDSFAILADNTGAVRAEYQGDLLHINQAGYNALNSELERLLVTLAK